VYCFKNNNQDDDEYFDNSVCTCFSNFSSIVKSMNLILRSYLVLHIFSTTCEDSNESPLLNAKKMKLKTILELTKSFLSQILASGNLLKQCMRMSLKFLDHNKRYRFGKYIRSIVLPTYNNL